MAVLEWDKAGEKTYQTGVERGVLYLGDKVAVWNGLISLEEDATAELKSYYMDGVKFLDSVIPGEFSGKLKAFTYPDEFDDAIGIIEHRPGLFYHEQPPKKFNLSYRTLVGNDLEGTDHGYRLHLLYNLVAVADATSFETMASSISPAEFSWALTGTPDVINSFRPMVHISIDSRQVYPEFLQNLEDILYGTDTTTPRFPPASEVAEIFSLEDTLIITDNGDGTWTADDFSNIYITMTDATTFEIHGADATYHTDDPDRYDISSTNVD
jgi:hypothetical protein